MRAVYPNQLDYAEVVIYYREINDSNSRAMQMHFFKSRPQFYFVFYLKIGVHGWPCGKRAHMSLLGSPLFCPLLASALALFSLLPVSLLTSVSLPPLASAFAFSSPVSVLSYICLCPLLASVFAFCSPLSRPLFASALTLCSPLSLLFA